MSNFLSTDIISINNPQVVKMMNDYFYEGYALFVLVLCELCKQEDYKYSLKDINVLFDNIKANLFLKDRSFINEFIHDCISKYESKGEYLLQSDGEMFWSDSLIKLINKRKTKKINGEKGGRPAKPVIQDRLLRNDIDFVNLEKSDYEKLINKFDKSIIDTGIQILDNWLAKGSKTAKEYIGKNHYGFFRRDSWVVNEAKKKLEKEKTSMWGDV